MSHPHSYTVEPGGWRRCRCGRHHEAPSISDGRRVGDTYAAGADCPAALRDALATVRDEERARVREVIARVRGDAERGMRSVAYRSGVEAVEDAVAAMWAGRG